MSSFSIRAAQETDISAINKLFCAEYGERYPYQIQYLCQDHLNLVACAKGQVVGFARAVPYGCYTHVWELCGLVVDPSFRGLGIAKAFTLERMQLLKERGVKTLVSEAVTCYEDCASQQNLLQFGFQPYGILPFVHPWIRPEVLGTQPLSLVLMVASLNGGTGFGNRPFFLHEQDWQALRLLIGDVQIHTSEVLFAGASQLEFRQMPGKKVQGIHGSDFVDFSLNTVQALGTASRLRQQGFRVAGILPGFGTDAAGQHTDLLRVYRPPQSDRPLTFDLVHVLPCLERFKQQCAENLSRS